VEREGGGEEGEDRACARERTCATHRPTYPPTNRARARERERGEREKARAREKDRAKAAAKISLKKKSINKRETEPWPTASISRRCARTGAERSADACRCMTVDWYWTS
jgi:hypothetical protein